VINDFNDTLITKTQKHDLVISMYIKRKKDFYELNEMFDNTSRPLLLVIRGRRRIGKSTFVKQFLVEKKLNFLNIQGLAPRPGQTNQDQINHFVNEANQIVKLPQAEYQEWSILFYDLSKAIKKKKFVVFLDEISWMGAHDLDFAGKLKNAWDLYFKDKYHLILCGSVSAWIEKNIIKSTDFVGRISKVIHLQELSLPQSLAFWNNNIDNTSFKEQLECMAVTGGVPLYLENLNPKKNAFDNLNHICFSPGSLLSREFESVFNDIFGKRSFIYKRIVLSLLNGPKSLLEISKSLKKEKSGVLTSYLNDLTLSGFIEKSYLHKIGGSPNKETRFRIKDNYLRFYLKYIGPHLHQIDQGKFKIKNLNALSNWNTIFGYQFESTVLNNLDIILEYLQIPSSDIISAGPFLQNATKQNKGKVQIDLLIETNRKEIFICEIKSAEYVGAKVITEMKHKINKIKASKFYTKRTVLIYIGILSNKQDLEEKIDFLIDYEVIVKKQAREVIKNDIIF
jgi:AAA+ ATPase superfamily predicted ATPase